TKQPSWANFCATAPPTPQRAPTGIWLSSSALPCANRVLRPSDCHLDVAPITTATGLLFLFCMDSPLQADRCQPHQAHSASPITSRLSGSLSHDSCSVNMVTHCRQEHGILEMSVPQNMRCGPNAS